MLNRRLLLLAVMAAMFPLACNSEPAANPGGEEPQDPGNAGDPGSENPPPQVSENALPDFSVTDVNVNSARSGEAVSPRDYVGQVSAWYFGHST